LDVTSLYKWFNNMGYLFAPLHQGISSIKAGTEYARARVVLPAALEGELERYSFHPALLDACSQVFLSFLPQDLPEDFIYITIGTDEFIPYRKAESELYVVAQVTSKTETSLKGNIYIYNYKHEKVATIIGYMTKKVNKAILQSAGSKGNDIFYKTEWSPKEGRSSVKSLQSGSFIIWAERSQFSLDLRNELEAAGCKCILVYSSRIFKKPNDYEFELDPVNTEHCSQFINALQLLNTNTPIRGSVYLWNLENSFSPLTRDIKEDVETVCKPLWDVAGQLFQREEYSPSLTFITQNAFNIQFGDYWVNPVSVSVWGFMKVMNLEYPRIRCMGIDINEKDSSHCKLIAAEILNQSNDKMIAIRNGQRYVPSLVKFASKSMEAGKTQVNFNKPYSLRLKAKGSIDYLDYEEVVRQDLSDNDIEIEVMAAGFNFRDIIQVLNLMDDEANWFGLDCTGRVTRKGKKVQNFEIGDIVVAFAPDCFGKYVTVNTDFAIKKPDNMNIFEAATIPAAYLTAFYIMRYLVTLKKGNSILIHAGTGGLGVALINLAKNMGLVVYATASRHKRFLLRQLGVEHIFDSRSTEYSEQIRQMTNGEGLDAVVNSFTGEHISKNFSLLKSGGHFIEVGERSTLTPEQVAAYRTDVKYSAFALFDVIEANPKIMKEMFSQLDDLLKNGRIKPIPYQIFDKKYVKDAFRFIQKGKHIGKILLNFSEGQQEVGQKNTVVIAGGSGGIGWEVVKYWAKNHNDFLVILGRRPQTEEIYEKLNQIREQGKDIVYYSVDIGNINELSAVFEQIYAKLPPLKGIVHSAGVISDNLIRNESWDNVEKVISPKMYGVWNLHTLTCTKELEFFILFSSVTAVMGSIGVSSYAVGNSYMDGFAQYRRQLGLPCLSLNWGPWQSVGMLTRLNAIAKEIWTQNGFKTLSTEEGLQVFDELKEHNGNISIMPVDWSKWLKQYQENKIPDMLFNFMGNCNSDKNNDKSVPVNNGGLAASGQLDTLSKVYDELTKMLKRVLQRDISNEELEKHSFQKIGLDSLMSVEFRNLLNEKFQTSFPVSLLYNYPDLGTLNRYICSEILKIGQNALEKEKTEPLSKLASGELDTSSKVYDEIAKILKRVLQRDISNEELEKHSFQKIGLDSLMSVEFRNLLNEKFQTSFAISLLYSYPDLNSLNQYICNEVLKLKQNGLEKEKSELQVKSDIDSSFPCDGGEESDLSIDKLRQLLDKKIKFHNLGM
ncbi:MAG TPA: SDR family NAD(P)-dependent oxidoreductase, partial [Ruminiclostridium sp.]|nr:SDR family NAD(P)-dependent oxidoreductase [Ruminiclostridium sp.]